MKGSSGYGIMGTLRMVMEETRRKGLMGMIRKIRMSNEFKFGRLIGSDEFGNEYFENRNYPQLRSRWVEYHNPSDFDASQVPSYWHHWLHYISDEAPVDSMKLPKYYSSHSRNQSGTSNAYLSSNHLISHHLRYKEMKYSHDSDGGLVLKPKIGVWNPNGDDEVKDMTDRSFHSYYHNRNKNS